MSPEKPKNETISVTVPAAVAERLEAIADERMIGKGVVVAKALEAFFKSLPPMPGSEPTVRPAVPSDSPAAK